MGIPLPPPSSGPFGLEGAGLGLEWAGPGVVLSQSPPSLTPPDFQGLVPGVSGPAFFAAVQLFPAPFHGSHSLAPLLLLGPPTFLFLVPVHLLFVYRVPGFVSS